MKISEITRNDLLKIPEEQKRQIICGDIGDEGKSAQVALLLGCNPSVAKERAIAAACLYREGRVQYIAPSGGVEWDTDGVMMSEALYMKKILLENGVSEDAIILENEARTTKENMIYGALRINRKLHFENIEHVIIVTTTSHMRRSLALARQFLPRKVSVSAYPAPNEASIDEINTELRVTKPIRTRRKGRISVLFAVIGLERFIYSCAQSRQKSLKIRSFEVAEF